MKLQKELNVLINAFNGGNFKEAERLSLAIAKLDPDNFIPWKALGLSLKNLKRFSEAVSPLQKAMELMPGDIEIMLNLGIVYTELAEYENAENIYWRVVSLKPDDYPETYLNLGVVLKYMGKNEEAEKCYRRAIEIKPDFAIAFNNLGVLLRDAGKLEESEECYKKVLEIKPDYPEAYLNLGVVLKYMGKNEEAEKCYRRAIEIKPDFTESYNNLAIILQDKKNYAEAEKYYRRAIELNPNYAEAYNNLGNLLKDAGRNKEAEIYYNLSLKINPKNYKVYNNLGLLCNDLQRLDDAETFYKKAIELNPNYAEAYNNLGNLFRIKNQLPVSVKTAETAIDKTAEIEIASAEFVSSEAEKYFRRAIELNPNYAEAYNNLGIALYDFNKFSEGQSYLLKAIELKHDFAEAYNNLLMNMNYEPAFNISRYKEYAHKFGEIISNGASNKYKTHTNTIHTYNIHNLKMPKEGDKLKVGFVSGDFNNHPVGYFLESMLSYIKQVELFAYVTHNKEDELTQRIKPYFFKWTEIYGKSDNEAADIIYKDGINVLIDLSGHTKHNRLKIFAYKPAPIQASWFGYPASTGVKEMDYFIGDPFVMPEDKKEEENHFIENVFRLPNIHYCFSSPKKAPDVGHLPFLRNGFITFGCFNNIAKVNDEVISLWSDILKSIPSAKLFLKTKQLNDKTLSEIFYQKFKSCGIAQDRLILEGSSPRYQLLDSYNKIDLALDPFPYNGGITTAEAIYMGVPVLTIKGNRYVSHVGESIAHNIGMPELIAEDKEDYVKKAKELVSDINALKNIRKNLRDRALKSPLFDGERFAKNFEDAIGNMWAMYIKNIRVS